MRFLFGVATALALALGGQAHALIAYSIGAVGGEDPGYSSGESSVVTFDPGSPNAPGILETDSGPANAVGLFTGTTVNVAATPVGDTTQFEALQIGGAAKLDFTHYAARLTSLSVYVGSIDSYNKFTISTSRSNYYFDGGDFLHHNGDQMSNQTNRRVYFLFAPNEVFKSITLASQGIAFEYDSFGADINPKPYRVPDGVDVQELFPTSVPEPATWAMMALGAGFLGAAVRRRRTQLAA